MVALQRISSILCVPLRTPSWAQASDYDRAPLICLYYLYSDRYCWLAPNITSLLHRDRQLSLIASPTLTYLLSRISACRATLRCLPTYLSDDLPTPPIWLEM